MSVLALRLWNSVAFRQALIYGALVVATTLVLLSVLYFQTVGVWQERIDGQIELTTGRLMGYFEDEGRASLARRIKQILGDGVNSDTEMYLLTDRQGQAIAGNLTVSPNISTPGSQIFEEQVFRLGRVVDGRFQVSALTDGGLLVVGRDMQDQRELEELIGRASILGGAITLLLAIVGALVFRRQLEQRISAIRQTAAHIENGDLSQRIPVSEQDDEFARLSRDINKMLDRIHDLMDGVRHVSNTIAHNIRTPLLRILARLRTAQLTSAEPRALGDAVEFVVHELEELNVVFDKLLRIAEVESGARRRTFVPVSLNAVAIEVLELYDAVAEEKRSELIHAFDGEPTTLGDADLLASAMANLVDNALKYTNDGSTIRVSTSREEHSVSIIVQDNGLGIPATERTRIGTRFFRLDNTVPGYGLGLASVVAIARLHGGNLHLDDAGPGLVARLVLPATVL